MYIGLHVFMYSRRIVVKLEFFQQILEQIIKYNISWQSVQ